MNGKECANCLVHGWLQPDNETSLLTCKNCKLIEYCSYECQDEHWSKVHKNQCQYFADPTKNEAWQHKETDCSICLKAAQVGESNLKDPNNPNYECVFKVEIPQTLLHPHPFPVTGQQGDIFEKGFIILWQLVRKFQLIHPQAARNYREEFLQIENILREERIAIWRDRKIFPQPEVQHSVKRIHPKLDDLHDKMKKMTNLEDSFKLWSIVTLVQDIVDCVEQVNRSKFFKDPLADLPEDLKKILSEGLDIDNTTKYMNVAGKVLEALSTQIIPYEDVLKIVGGGSLEQECGYCSEEVDMSSDGGVLFNLLRPGKYVCGSQDCQDKAVVDDQGRLSAILTIMWRERSVNMCDFCFQRTPVKKVGSDIHDIHRCSLCKTTMYCSRDCQVRDYDQVHGKACKKDKEGRKKKMRGSDRRKAAREQIERMETETTDTFFHEILDTFKQKIL